MAQLNLKAVRLRPHHLLCVRTFSGAGYGHEFIDNMHRIASACKSPSRAIKIVEGLDDICICCPHSQGSLCIRNDDLTKALDKKTLSILGLELGSVHSSRDLGVMIEAAIRQKLFCDVCKKCDWYDIYCRSFFCNGIV